MDWGDGWGRWGRWLWEMNGGDEGRANDRPAECVAASHLRLDLNDCEDHRGRGIIDGAHI